MLHRQRRGPVRLRVVTAQVEELFTDQVRVAHVHRNFSKAGQIIVVRHGAKWIPAAARGALKRDETTIQLDQASRKRLALRPNQEAEFTFESAGLWAHLTWAWTASNPVVRISAQLGVLSVILGTIGLALGLLSMFLAL
jgi:hypothetical protein